MAPRRHALPDAIRRVVPIPPGDRILASAELTNGSWLVAERGSVAVVNDLEVLVARPWCDVQGASFDPEAATLTVTWVDGTDPLVATVADVKRLTVVRTVRERVESSVILAETVTVADSRTVRVAVRRDAAGHLFSQVVADVGVNLDEPGTTARVDAAEARVRAASGLPL